MKYVYRIVNGLLAAAIFPATLFVQFIYLGIALDAADAAVVESFSLMKIINILTGRDSYSKFFSLAKSDNGSILWPSEFAPINKFILIFAIAFVLILVTAIFIIVWSICSNKRLPVLIASIAGLGFTATFIISFHAFAEKFVSGEVNLINAIGGDGILATLAGNFLGVNHFDLNGIDNAYILIFAGLIIWTVAFYLVEIGEPKDTPEKKPKH